MASFTNPSQVILMEPKEMFALGWLVAQGDQLMINGKPHVRFSVSYSLHPFSSLRIVREIEKVWDVTVQPEIPYRVRVDEGKLFVKVGSFRVPPELDAHFQICLYPYMGTRDFAHPDVFDLAPELRKRYVEGLLGLNVPVKWPKQGCHINELRVHMFGGALDLFLLLHDLCEVKLMTCTSHTGRDNGERIVVLKGVEGWWKKCDQNYLTSAKIII